MKISIAAVVKRINRRLAPDGERIRKVRGERARRDLGDFWVQDVNRNFVVTMHVDPEQYAREISLLAPFEEVAGH